jgi:putative tryptophan/tyrosine transport system substrate-binding protein
MQYKKYIGKKILILDYYDISLKNLFFIFFISICGSQIIHSTNVFAQEDRENIFQIEMVVWRGCEDACKGFRTMLKNQGIPHLLNIHDVATDASKIPEVVRKIRSRKPDLVVTWGTTVTLNVFGPYDDIDPGKHITEIPGVFMIVSQPVEAKVVPSLAGSGRHITGTSYLVPVSKQIDAALTYMPFRRIGVIYNPDERNSTINVAQLQDLAESYNLEIIERAVPKAPNGKRDPEAISRLVRELASESVDLIYQGADSFLNINRNLLTESAVEHQIPVFSSGHDPVRFSSALISVANDYSSVGEFTALKAIKVLKGADTESMEILSPPRFSFLVNVPIAQKLELYPPVDLLRVAHFINSMEK